MNINDLNEMAIKGLENVAENAFYAHSPDEISFFLRTPISRGSQRISLGYVFTAPVPPWCPWGRDTTTAQFVLYKDVDASTCPGYVALMKEVIATATILGENALVSYRLAYKRYNENNLRQD